jgi:protochlorophyllide reductase
MTTSAMTSQHLHARVARANAARGLRARVVAPAGRSIATARRSAIAVSAARAETDDAASAPASASSRRDVVLGGALALASSALAATTPVAIADEAPTTTETTTTTTRDRKSVVVTGSNSGIGLDGAAKLAARGYDVTLACRTLAKAQAAKASIEATAAANGVVLTGSLTPAECDLASLDSIRAFAASRRAAPLDALVLNAGVEFSGDNTVRRTADGFEITVGVNHLGHFLLTNLLLPDLEAAASASPQSDGTTPPPRAGTSASARPSATSEGWPRTAPRSRCSTGRRTTRTRRTRIRSCATSSSRASFNGD